MLALFPDTNSLCRTKGRSGNLRPLQISVQVHLHDTVRDGILVLLERAT
jgi:hypothetical protein